VKRMVEKADYEKGFEDGYEKKREEIIEMLEEIPVRKVSECPNCGDSFDGHDRGKCMGCDILLDELELIPKNSLKSKFETGNEIKLTDNEKKMLKERGLNPRKIFNSTGEGAHKKLKKIRKELEKGEEG